MNGPRPQPPASPGAAVTAEEWLASFRSLYPGRMFWVVPTFAGPTVWCSRRRRGGYDAGFSGAGQGPASGSRFASWS